MNLTYLALLMIFLYQLSIIRWYISLSNRDIKIKTRITSFISWIANIKKANSNVKTYNIIEKRNSNRLS